MRPKSRTLTEQELEIMKVVWELQTATVRDVYEALLRRRKIAYTTVMTMMNILEEKGYLKKRAEDKAHVYRPAQAKAKVIRAMVQEFVERVFNGSAEPLLVHLVKDRHLSPRGAGEDRAHHQGERMSPPLWFANSAFVLPAGHSAGRGGHGPSRIVSAARAARPAGVLARIAGDLPGVARASALEASGRRFLDSGWDGVDQFSGRPRDTAESHSSLYPFIAGVLLAGMLIRLGWLALGLGKLRAIRRGAQRV